MPMIAMTDWTSTPSFLSRLSPTLSINLPDSAEIRGYHFNTSSGRETKFSILPTRTTNRFFSKCASYDIQPHRENLFKIVISSPMDIMVMFHHRDQLNIHRELSAGFFFQGLKWDISIFTFTSHFDF